MLFMTVKRQIGKAISLGIVFIFMGLIAGLAQQSSARQMQEAAKSLLQQGEYEKAIRVLELATEQSPKDVELLKDLSFAAYLNRDFSKAMQVGKIAIQQSDADAQAYQLLGLTYKALAMNKECAKLYITALRKFPNSGIIYNEYAELLAIDKQMDEAIIQWEKGIKSDPSFSGNYFNAAMYYSRSNDWLKVLLYGEIFVNIESYTDRTNEVKGLLVTAANNLFRKNTLEHFLNEKGKTPFEQLVLGDFLKVIGQQKVPASLDSLTAIRSRFIVEWIDRHEANYPYRLFNHLQYLIKHGLFDAYSHWLFSAAENQAEYQEWLRNHIREKEAFQTFQQSRVFKLPSGQYYF
jgi:tetratricopeptide (TPR) repeat protein